MTRISHAGTCAIARLLMLVCVTLIVVQAHGQNSSTAASFVDKGVLELQKGNPDGASALFLEALKKDPRNSEAHTYLGVIADEKNDMQSAERHFAAAASLAPNSASARNNHGAVLMKMGRRPEAISEFEKSLKLDDHQPGTLLNLGQAYFDGGTEAELRRARELFSAAEKLSADAAPARAFLVASIRLRDPDAVAQEYPKYQEKISEAPVELSGPAPRLELGQSMLELGLYDQAADELNAVLATAPDNPSALVGLAKAYRLGGHVADAGKLLESAVARGLKSGVIYEELAEVYDASGHVENAIPAMRLAIAADPKNEYYHLRYGLLLNDTQAPAAAVLRLKEAVGMFPESAAIRFALGLAYYADHKNQEAADCFEKAVTLDAKFAPAYAYRGLILADAGKYSDAVQQYEKSIALDAKVAVVHELLAESILRQPNPDTIKAERELRRAIELDPRYIPAGMELAKLLQRQGNAEGAAKELERVVEINPKLAEPHYLLGRSYAAMKRSDDSKREFDLFRELDKASKQAEVDARNDLLRRLSNVRY